jgi:hypothetical protein
MAKIKIIKLKDIKSFLGKIPITLGKNAFLVFLALFLLSLAFGAFIFYRHHAIIEQETLEAGEKQLQFKTELYNTILETWQKREERFKKTDSKIYPNPFAL